MLPPFQPPGGLCAAIGQRPQLAGQVPARVGHVGCRGNEDLNVHDQLRHDPLLPLLCGRKDITGSDRRDARDQGKALAGKSSLNRLELTPVGADAESRSKKIVAHVGGLQNALVDVFIRLRPAVRRDDVLPQRLATQPL